MAAASADADFHLSKAHLKKALKTLARRDADVAAALKAAGYPEERRNVAGYRTLMHIIVAQQLSTKAAQTIVGRLEAATRPRLTAPRFLTLSEEELRAIGFSGQKIKYGRGLSEAVAAGSFRPASLKHMNDEEALAAITAFKGFGRWSAEMYLLFSLGRPDVWPAGDLAVQEAVKRLKGLAERPSLDEMDEIAEPWRPYRGAAAIFMWHYYRHDPAV